MSSILDQFRLDDQVAIVTGSGRGIGAATAIAFADAAPTSWCLLAASRSSKRPRRRCALGAAARWSSPCDVLDAEQRKHLVDKAVDEFTRLDILVNNAGGWPPKPSLETSEDEFEACFRFNVTTAFAMTPLGPCPGS